ncbi:MAG TPA: hypothetical protein PLH68_01575, partial [Anaerolineaceae bacterium]|nr:hypothetical protein [Anaerolineaceae bacterium]
MQTSYETSPFQTAFRLTLILGVVLLSLAASSAAVWNPIQGLREFSRSVEFDFTEWTVQALFQKGVSAALRAEKFLSPAQQNSLIQTYLEQVYTSAVWNARLDQAVSQPNLVGRKVQITVARDGLRKAEQRLAALSPLTEAVVQSRTENTLTKMGFGL